MDWLKRAENSIAQVALTNSKRPSQFVRGVYPTHIVKGEGCFLFDENGKRYLDYICALGANLMGYAHPKINISILNQMYRGATHSLPTTLEVEVAEKIKEVFGVERVRFFKTGSEACSAAVRIARANKSLNKRKIRSTGYHGWSDMFTSLTKPALGVFDTHYIYEYKEEDDLEDAAAVIVEPVELDISLGRKEYLQRIRANCDKSKSLLIFDEIITALRFPKMSVSQYWDIKPDIIIGSKGLGNGLPIDFVGGSNEVMNCGEWFCSGTFNGETLSLAAAKCVLEEWPRMDINYLWEAGQRFINGFNAIDKDIQLVGYPTRCTWAGNELKRALLWQECCKAGILFGRAWFYTHNHIPHNDYVLNICKTIIRRINNGDIKLEGQIPQESFKR